MPDKGQYKLVFDGRILAGHNLDDVKKRLARLLKSDSKKIEQLLAEAPLTIKNNIDYPTASKYKETLRAAGVSCQIERIENNDVEVSPPPRTPADRSPEAGNAPMAGTNVNAAVSRVRLRPGRIWYVIAVLLIGVPIIFGGIKMPLTLFSYLAAGIEFTAPGAAEFTINQPGKYVIWYTTFDGHSHRRDIPQDIKIVVYNQNTERYLEVGLPGWESTETVLDVERQSIAEVFFDQAGVYAIEVNGDFPETDLILRRSLSSGFFKNFVIPILMFLTGSLVGLTMAIVVYIKRSNAESCMSPAAMTQKEERQWAMFSHLGTFSACLIPFGNIIVPLVIWQVKKGESSFTVEHSKESLNFQISLMIYYIAATLLILVIIGFILFIGLFIFNIIIVIIAGLKANEGQYYKYPMTIRFIK
ncbi:hypothetical protein D1BOALGB6SA_1761 [Olavius sp. associated proteobacterium Delta 1]|nr:hypothetical protein D1BOALGB6SA_1761 [Olavius sp. associated proteobacterium Delta 1]